MKNNFFVRYMVLVLSFFILGSAFAKPKVRPYSQRVNGDRYVGVKLTWTFFVAPKNNNSLDSVASAKKPLLNSRTEVEFSSLEAALSDPRVSAADKLLIKNTYIPKLNRFNADLKRLNLDAAKKLANGKPALDNSTFLKRFNSLVDQHGQGLSIQKLSTNAISE